MRLFLVVALLSASLAAAQSTDAPKNARLEGRVLSTTGEPVKNATLTLAGRASQSGGSPASYSQSSDSDGKFAFEALPPGSYLLLARKDGFGINPSSAAPLTLTSGQAIKDLVVKLTPLGVITGHVTDQDGDPVTNAQVRVLRYTYTGGHKQLANVSGGVSDDKGNFRIFNVAPGLYYVNVIPRPAVVPLGTEAAWRESNITTYYPSSLDPASATPLNLLAGGELRGIDIRVRKGRVYSIRGRAVDTANGAAVSTRIALSSREDSSVNMSSFPQPARPADGTFEFRNLTPGTYVLQVRPLPQPPPGVQANATPNSNFIGSLEVTIKDSDVDGVLLALTAAAGLEISGSIKLEDGDIKQLAGLSRGPLPFVTLREVEVLSGMLRPEIRDDGTFRFQGVLPSRYLVDFTPLQAALSVLTLLGLPAGASEKLGLPVLPQGLYVKSVRFAGQDVTHAPLDFTSGVSGTLQIVLSAKAAAVMATVRDSQGNPNSTARIALWPKSPDLGSPVGGLRFSSPIAAPSGGNRINGLAPGDYYVAAWDDVDPSLFENPDFLSLFAHDASSVKLGEGASETVEVKLFSKEKIAAVVAALP